MKPTLLANRGVSRIACRNSWNPGRSFSTREMARAKPDLLSGPEPLQKGLVLRGHLHGINSTDHPAGFLWHAARDSQANAWESGIPE